MRRFRHLIFWLCVGWTAFVWSILTWQAFHYTGLFRWFAEWQLAHWGQYRTNLTVFVIGFTLTGPALHWLGCDERLRQKQEALHGDPAAKTVRARRFSFWMSGVATLIALLAWARLQQFPPAQAAPTEIDLATLGTAEPAPGNAILIGVVDTQSSITTTHTSRHYQRHTAYFPVHPLNSPHGPARFWVDRTTMTFSPPSDRPRHFFLDHRLQGALVPNGLPGQARFAIQKAGIALPENHYLLTTSSDGGREPCLVAAILGSTVSTLFLIAAALQTRMISKIRANPLLMRPGTSRDDF